MKKAIYFSIVALMFSVASFAQQNNEQTDQPKERKAPTVEEIAKFRAERMRKQLLLGNDQYDKVYKLCLEQAKKDQARQEKVKAEKEAFAKDMKGILNEAQQERFEELQQPRRKGPNQFGQRNGNFGPQNRQGKAIVMPQKFQAPQFQKAGEIRDPKLEMNRRRRMADDTKGLEQNTKPTPETEQQSPEDDLAAVSFDRGVLSPYIIESVEADLLG